MTIAFFACLNSFAQYGTPEEALKNVGKNCPSGQAVYAGQNDPNKVGTISWGKTTENSRQGGSYSVGGGANAGASAPIPKTPINANVGAELKGGYQSSRTDTKTTTNEAGTAGWKCKE